MALPPRVGGSRQPRCFTSRHVPSVAEALVAGPVASPAATAKLQGLLRHLKQNSTESDERQRRAVAHDWEAFVPEEFDDILRSEFERRCCFGDRANTELMTSAKFVKLLQDCGAVSSGSAAARAAQQGSPQMGQISLATADLIFHKVIRINNHGGKRLTYELFCKALVLVAQSLRPDVETKAAFAALLSKVAGLVPVGAIRPGEDISNLSLDPSVILALDRFKPKLTELFRVFCSRYIGSSSHRARLNGPVAKTRQRHDFRPGSSQGTATCSLDLSTMSTCRQSQGSSSSLRASETTASDLMEEEDSLPSVNANWGSPSGSAGASGEEAVQKSAEDTPPAPRKERAYMSLEQFLLLCKELGIMPDLLSRLEIIAIFKRSQSTSLPQGHGSSLRGLLSCEEFIDATGQLAIEAFSKPPFAQEHPLPHDKVQEFFRELLPTDVRELRERFLYGCNRVATGSFIN